MLFFGTWRGIFEPSLEELPCFILFYECNLLISPKCTAEHLASKPEEYNQVLNMEEI